MWGARKPRRGLPPLYDYGMITAFDQQMMHRCLVLARIASGQTAPNPLVGAVVTQGERVVGEGYHPRAGEPHAEVFALQQAGDRAQGATLYVNLEPCNHYGRTPPCSEAVIRAGIRRVVVGMIDPNPKVAGGGIARLREAGLDVVVGVEEAHCRELNEAFAYRILNQRPFGILKYAMTLDGKIATTTGHSAWVSSPEARSLVHRVRASCDAVIVGGNTVRRDNPLLTSHGVGHNPLRIVMSRTLVLPDTAQLWQTDTVPTLVFTEMGQNPAMQAHLKQRGVDVQELPALTPTAVMTHLYDRGLLSVLWECGGQLAARAIAERAVQKVMAFIAPKVIGGAAAPSPVGDLGLTVMTSALPIQQMRWQGIGTDLLIEGYLEAVYG